MKKNIILLIFICLVVETIGAQSTHTLLRDGNESYEQKDYAGAAENYYKALEKDPSNLKGKFNLGNATYKNEGYDEAIKHYSTAVELATDEETKSNAYYNLGNAYFKKQEMEKSVESYKNSLRLNPSDVSTKKNLALAQRIIQQQQQEQQQQNKDDQNQDQKDKEDQQQQQDQQQNQDQQQQDQEQQQNQDQQQQAQQQEQKDLNKEEAMQLLKIMDEEERKVQEKLRKAKSSNKKPEKDW